MIGGGLWTTINSESAGQGQGTERLWGLEIRAWEILNLEADWLIDVHSLTLFIHHPQGSPSPCLLCVLSLQEDQGGRQILCHPETAQ